jgi:hypothetical protein
LIRLRQEQSAVDKGLGYIHSRDDRDIAYEFIKLYYWSGKYTYYGAWKKANISSQYMADNIIREFRKYIAEPLGKVEWKC